MPIASKRHTGDPATFVVVTPIPLSRKLNGVTFLEGRGVTRHEAKARQFDESFGYTVFLPKGHKPWELASPEVALREDEMSEAYSLVDEDEDDDDAAEDAE